MKICKKFASVFLAVLIMLSVMPIAGIDFFRAGAFDSFGQITNTVSYTFDAYTGTMTISGEGELSDAEYIDNFDMYSSPFYENNYINSVIIEDGVVNIPYKMFDNCDSLETVTISDSVKTIESEAFSECDNLKTVTIGSSVEYIGAYAFINTSMGSVPVDFFYNGIYEQWKEIKIEYEDDLYCVSAMGIHLIDGKTAITPGIYYSFDEATCEMTVGGEGEMHLPSYYSENYYYDLALFPLEDNDIIKSVVIEDGITAVYCFYDCDSLETVTISDSVKTVGVGAFAYCDNLKSVTIGSSVEYISGFSFVKGYGEATYADFTYNGTFEQWNEIEFEYDYEDMFYSSAVRGVHLSDGKTAMAPHIYYTFDEATGTMTVGGNGDICSPGYYFDSSFYPFDYNNSIRSVVIEDGIESVCGFYDCDSLETVTISDSVKTLGAGAFVDCDNLKSVTIGSSVEYISGYSFVKSYGAPTYADFTYNGTFEQWNKIEIESGYEDIFYGSAVRGVHLSDGKTAMAPHVYYIFDEATGTMTVGGSGNIYGPGYYFNSDYYPFDYNDSIRSVVIGDGIKSVIGFNDCTNLESVTLGSSVEKIEAAFYRPSYNNEPPIDIFYHGTLEQWNKIEKDEYFFDGYSPKSVHLIDDKTLITENVYYTFDEATGTMTVGGSGEIPDHYGDTPETSAFVESSLIKNIVIGDGITGIGNRRFSGCDNLESVTIGSGVKKMGEVFYRYSYEDHPIEVYYNGTLEQWNEIEKDEYFFEYASESVHLIDGKTAVSENVYYTFDEATGTMIFNGEGEIPDCPYYFLTTHPLNENGSVKSIIIGNGITAIGECMFMNCDSLESVTISGSVAEIGYGVFRESDNLTDIYYVGTEEEWNAIEKEYFEASCRPDVTIHFITVADEPISGNSALELNSADGGEMTISGFTAGATVSNLAEMTAEGWTASVATADGSDRIGTGSVITLTSAEGETIECTAVVYGDTNGDAWYDGTDSTLVSCLAGGLLSKEQVGEAAYTAADCNHDGVIDENDVALLEQAGLILANVDQSKTPDELHEDAAFSEYLNLISQTAQAEEIVPDTAPETAETEITPTFIQRIINLIRTILSIVVLLFK